MMDEPADVDGDAGTTVTGGCQCGAVRYRARGARSAYCCHCSECRKQSASAFGISVRVERARFAVEGPLRRWTRPTESGSSTDCWFCEVCGTRVYHDGAGRPGYVTVKGGSLDDPESVPIVAHIWTSRRRRDLPLDPDEVAWERQPEGEEEWRALIDRS